MSKKKFPKEDFLTFSGISNDRAPRANTQGADRNLAEELYKKNWQSQSIDAFEKAIGIAPKQKKPNLKFKSRVFSPDFEKDAALLNELMNHPKYSITYWKDNWTMEGLYKAYIIYSENLDYIDPADKLKEIAEGNE